MYLRGGMVLQSASGSSGPVKSDPIALARDWVNAGAELIHIIDLDSPASGPSPNTGVLKQISEKLKVPFEIGGNVRSIDTAEKYVQAGAQKIILGSIAYQKHDFLESICKKFPGKIAAIIDVRRGKVVIKGWAVASNKSAIDYTDQFKTAGVSAIYLSDSDDECKIGMEDIGRIRDFLRNTKMAVIHTTDITTVHDLEQLITLESYGLLGTLLTKSIYDGTVSLENAITFAKEKSAGGLDEPTLQEA